MASTAIANKKVVWDSKIHYQAPRYIVEITSMSPYGRENDLWEPVHITDDIDDAIERAISMVDDYTHSRVVDTHQ